MGLAAEANVPLDVLEVTHNEIDLHGSFRYANTYEAAIDLLADDVVDVEGIVDFERPLDRVDEAFRRSMRPDVVKGMISVGE